MNRKNISNLLAAVTLLICLSCNKGIVPSSVIRSGKNYDSAAFDYIFIEAIKLKMVGNAGEALKYFEQCLKLNPGSDAAYYQMAQIILSTGDILNGRKFLLKAIECAPLNKWYPVMMAGTYYQAGNLDSAIYFYEKAVKNSPEKEEIQLTLGNLYSENNQYDKAGKIFEELDRKYGINESSTLAAIKNYISAGKYQDAYNKVMLLIAENPEEIMYYGLLAEIYRGLGEKEKAVGVYAKLMEENPGNPGTLLSLGNFLLQERSYEEFLNVLNTILLNENVSRDEKVTLFSQILEENELIGKFNNQLQVNAMLMEATFPDDNIVQIIRPEILIANNDQKSAISLLEEIIYKNKGNYYAWEKLLLSYFATKDFKNLQEKGEICSSMFNRSFIAKILYATGATENLDYATALSELDKAQILAGSDKDMLMQVLSVRADVYYRKKDFEQTFKTYEEALKINNNDLTILNNYAYYLAEQNINLKAAEEMSRRVIDQDRNNPTFLDTYAWVLYKRGKIKEASRIMDSIIKNGKDADPDLYEHFGYILKRKKEFARAIEMWEKALKIDGTKTELLKEISNCKR